MIIGVICSTSRSTVTPVLVKKYQNTNNIKERCYLYLDLDLNSFRTCCERELKTHIFMLIAFRPRH